MTPGDDDIGEVDLHAYADGRLDRDPARKAQVEAYLRERPELREKVEAYRRVTREIAAAYDPVLAEPVPERLTRVLESDPAPRARAVFARGAVAAVLLLLVAGGGWWVGHERIMFGDGEAVAARFERLHVTAVEALGQAGLGESGGQAPAQLTGAGGNGQLTSPDLSQIGYRLVDRRVMNRGEESVVQFVYRDSEGTLMTVAVKGDPDDAPPPRIDRGGEADVAYWREGALTVGIVGRPLTDEIDSVARAVNEALANMVGPGTPDVLGPADPAQRPSADALLPGGTVPLDSQSASEQESVVQ